MDRSSARPSSLGGEKAAAFRAGAIVLAAGRSGRMGHNKLLAPLAGMPVICHALAAVNAAFYDPAIVVTGHEAERIEATLAGANAKFVFAADHAVGMSQSLKAGVLAIPQDWNAALVCLGDMPLISTGLIEALLLKARSDRIVIPRFNGVRGNPVLWGRAFFHRLGKLSGDAGGKLLFAQSREHIVYVDWPDADANRDVDEPDALREVQHIVARLRT